MADFGGGTAAGALNVGSLVVNLTMNTGELKKGLDDIKKDTSSAAALMKKEWDAAGGALGKFGSSINEIRESTIKMFGDKAPLVLQKFGKEMGTALGLGSEKMKGLEGAVGALGGAFKVAGTAVGMLATPLGLVVGLLGGAVIAIHAAVKAGSGLAGPKGNWFAERAKDFRVGVTQIFGSEEAKKQQYWEMSGPSGQSAMLAQRAALTAKLSKEGQLNGSDAEVFSQLEKRIPSNILAGNKAITDDSPLFKLDKWLSDLENQVGKLLTPGVTDADSKKYASDRKSALAKAFADNEEAIKAEREYNEKDAERKFEDQQFLEEQNRKWIDAEAAVAAAKIDAGKEEWTSLMKRNEDQRALDKLKRDINAEEKNRTSAKWQALGSGQFGTAAGVSGIAGAAMNILGGKMSESPLTGRALQGAAQGGEVGGIWGAIIGAILALLGETKTFGKIMSMIEGLLGDILPVLDQILEPLIQILEPLFEALSPILDLIATILGALGDVLMDLTGAVQSLVDSDLGAGYSFKDYTTPSGWISIIMDEIHKGEQNAADELARRQAGGAYLKDMFKDGASVNYGGRGKMNIGSIRPDDQALKNEWMASDAGSNYNYGKPDGIDYETWKKMKYPGASETPETKAFKEQWNAGIEAQKKEQEARASAEKIFLESTGMTLTSFETLQRKTDFVSQVMSGLATSTEQAKWSLEQMSDAKWLEAYEGNYMAMREAQDKKKEIDDKLEADYRALHPELYALADAAGNAARAADSLSESLTNLPIGYSLKGRQYGAVGNATGGGSLVSGPGSSSAPTDWGNGTEMGGGGGGGGGGVTIYVDGSKDPKVVAQEVKRLLDRDNFLTTGSLVPLGPEF